jgi:hypothetical protein
MPIQATLSTYISLCLVGSCYGKLGQVKPGYARLSNVCHVKSGYARLRNFRTV